MKQMQMAAVPGPEKPDLEYIRQTFQQRSATRLTSTLVGCDQKVWGDPDDPKGLAEDLMVIRPRSVEDPFTTWVAGPVMTWLYQAVWCRLFPKRLGPGKVKNAAILRATSACTTVIACSLLVGSIAVLYCVQTMRGRLGLIAGLTVLFAISIMLFTSAKRSEVFTATAAYVISILLVRLCFICKEWIGLWQLSHPVVLLTDDRRFAAVQVVFISGNNACVASPSTAT